MLYRSSRTAIVENNQSIKMHQERLDAIEMALEGRYIGKTALLLAQANKSWNKSLIYRNR